jgi:1,4-alpha-glucan branching enzyme
MCLKYTFKNTIATHNMRTVYLIACLFIAVTAKAQLLSWTPNFIQDSSSSVSIIADASKGSQGLFNYTSTSDVYVHIGVITNYSTGSGNWLHVPSFSAWGTTNTQIQTTYLGNNKWQYTINGGLRAFFGMTDPNEKILKIAILFRNGSGSLKLSNTDGSDMYVPVYDNGLYARLDVPLRQPKYIPVLETLTKNVGNTVNITAKSSKSATINILFNGTQIATASSSTVLNASATITSTGLQTIIAQANNGTTASNDTSTFFVSAPTNVAALPQGTVDGINYETGDTSVVLVLYAPFKTKVSVIGDFNSWTQSTSYQLNRTPDSLRYWIRVKGLTTGAEYAYQYVIDDTLTVADYNTEKILDKNNDPYISSTTYPNLKQFPAQATGNSIVSILQTAKPQYNWQVTNFTKPDKRNLVIYELLVRDFIAAGNWQTLKDTLSYLKRLGVNAIELMPFNEFEGNSSWGYNPSFYFAPDKAYGTEAALKQFIDVCHQNGMAVIQDMVMNHSFGTSPMVQMYWNGMLGAPAANSPWFNQYATHAYNVGYQFNHLSQATIDFRNRVIAHWLTKYKIDGFRWDLAKGFTQKRTCDAMGNNCNVAAWGNYDTARVATWKNIYDQMQSVSNNSYCILEMFADNSEETVEANYGMMLWGNMNSNFNQATMGFSNPSWDLSYGIYTSRGWSQPNLITYQESHDEERLMYKNIQYGNSSSSYNIKDLNTGLKRNEMATAFWAMIPGPKMLWQFGELGYDFSINTCTNGTVDATGGCRLSPKPIHWEYYQNANRLSLYNVYAQLIKLRTTAKYANTFIAGNINPNLSGALKTLVITGDSISVVVVGNFDVVQQAGTITFPSAGTWYNYLGSTTRTATGYAENITLQPGEYYVYTNKNVNNTVATAVINVNSNLLNMDVSIYPDPVNSISTVAYNLPESGIVNISAIAADGRNLGVLFSGFKNRGPQLMQLNANTINAGNGMYLLQIEVNGKRKIEKFVMNK